MIARNARVASVTSRPNTVVPPRPATRTEWDLFLARPYPGKSVLTLRSNQVIFTQGQPADALFVLLSGRVKLAVSSQDGKEAILRTLGAGEFFGEGCLGDAVLRPATAIAVGSCTMVRIEKATIARMLREQEGLAQFFVGRLLTRLVRSEADLIDQLFNSSEKRLARTLLLLSHFGPKSTSETVVAGINQEHLAQMVGTTRSRVNYFLNKFRTRGFIEYNGVAGFTVHRGLLAMVEGLDYSE